MKPIKKLFKIAGILTVSFLLFLALLVGVAKVYEDELIALTLEKLEEEIEAPITIGKVSLIPLFSFPRLSAEINQFWIGEPSSRNTDTLFFINSLKLSLDSWDLINGIYTVNKLEVAGLDFDYTIDKNGKSNIDFILDSFIDTIQENKNTVNNTLPELNVDKLKLKNIHINYYDSLTQVGTRVFIPEISIKAKTKNSVYSGKTKGSLVLSNCHLDSTKLSQMESCTVNFDMAYENNQVFVDKISIISEGAKLGMEGVVGLGDKIMADAVIEAKMLDFDILKKYLPNGFGHLFGNTNAKLLEHTKLELKLEYENNNVDVKKLSLNNDGIGLSMETMFKLGDTLAIDANIESLSLDLDFLKHYVPKAYFKEYGIVDVGGILDISATVKGKYADSTLLPILDADVNFKKFRLQTADYPKIDTVNLVFSFNSGTKPSLSEASINITNLDVALSQSRVHLNGIINNFETPHYNFSSDVDLNLSDFSKFFPDTLIQNATGKIFATAMTSGIFPKNKQDDFMDHVLDKSTVSIHLRQVSALINDSLQVEGVNADFSYSPLKSGSKEILVKKLSLKSEKLNLDLQNSSLSLLLSGKFSNPEKMRADLQSFNLQSGENKIYGSAHIQNFKTPEFRVESNIALNLKDLMSFVPNEFVKNMKGNIRASISSNAKINPDSLDTQLVPILFENSNLQFKLDDVSLAFPDSLMDIDNISAQISLKKDVLKIDGFTATYNDLKIEMDSSTVQNIYKTVVLNTNEQLYVKTHIKIGDIFFDDFKHFLASNSTNSESISASDTVTSSYSKNWTYLIHGTASVNSINVDTTVLEGFSINRLHIDEVSALFKFTDSSYIFDQFKCKVFEGEMNNSLHFKIRDDGTQSVSTHTLIQNMNIRTMLRDMDNFGMDSLITYKNISGILSTDINTFIPINDSVLMDKMMVSGDITLEKGGVYNYEPAEQISKFTSIKELDNIQFKTLKSNVFLFKNKLYVPRTNIVSNAIDIAAYGMQNLDGDSEYHLELHLSNILFGKSKRRNKKQEKRGEEVDESTLKKNSQKVKYTVKNGKSRVGRGTKEDREKMMNRIRVQNKMLDFIFFPKNIHYSTDVN